MSAGRMGNEAAGAWLRQSRMAARLTQEELAERSGVSVRTIGDLERGVPTRPYPRSIRSLIKALALPGSLADEVIAGYRHGGAPVARPGQAAGHGPGEVVPRQLPAIVAHFTGRAAELDVLAGLAGGSAEGAVQTAVISAIDGTPGVGKTALAVHFAHRATELFPDGQLYVNLAGFGPSGSPLAPGQALCGFLGALGVRRERIPAGLDSQAGLYRSLLAGRRMLVLLDNAADEQQVRPLLPGSPGCLTVVTSRQQLAGLAAAEGATLISLNCLSETEARELLAARLGSGRVAAEPGALDEVVRLCAGLPLALAIAAARGVVRPRFSLAELAAGLRQAGNTLDALDVRAEGASIRPVFSWSYHALSQPAARMFRLLSLHPGPEVSVAAAARLADLGRPAAHRLLEGLTRASLLTELHPGRYVLHDLLHAYAAEQAAGDESSGQCEQALTRLFDHYLTTSSAAMNILYPAEAHRRPHVPVLAAAAVALAGEADARAWLNTERANLVAMAAHCSGHGWPRHATDLAATLFRYLISGGHLPEARTIYCNALHAARLAGDLAAEAEALNGLGGIAVMNGQPRDAVGQYRAALERYRRCGDRAGEARALHNLGITDKELHHYHAAADHYRHAIAAFEDAGDGLGAARALAYLAAAETELGSYDQAAEHLWRALPVLQDAKDPAGEADTLGRIGMLNLRRGQLDQATTFFERALAIYRSLDHPGGIAAELCNLGKVSVHQGQHRKAIRSARQALALYRETGNQHGEAVALHTLAQALHGAGQTTAAQAEFGRALRLATETSNIHLQASVHHDLADSHACGGQDDLADQHRQQALDLLVQPGATEMGHTDQ
jgi:tetratricopeptide (TPR) repeat protein/DNA-binding XRE family transcriptional regulator